ncbi:uncharacterized protein [Thunnus thynnus]|uniref:uncharacterized protein n=1 Tax=Thunnus thynnus TaxID=8237 RepID=UPI0035299C64
MAASLGLCETEQVFMAGVRPALQGAVPSYTPLTVSTPGTSSFATTVTSRRSVIAKCAELEEEIQCMTAHPGPDRVCLNPWVLQAVYNSYRQDYDELETQQHVERHIRLHRL